MNYSVDSRSVIFFCSVMILSCNPPTLSLLPLWREDIPRNNREYKWISRFSTSRRRSRSLSFLSWSSAIRTVILDPFTIRPFRDSIPSMFYTSGREEGEEVYLVDMDETETTRSATERSGSVVEIFYASDSRDFRE